MSPGHRSRPERASQCPTASPTHPVRLSFAPGAKSVGVSASTMRLLTTHLGEWLCRNSEYRAERLSGIVNQRKSERRQHRHFRLYWFEIVLNDHRRTS